MTVHIEKGYDVLARAMRRVTITVYGPDGRPGQVYYADRARRTAAASGLGQGRTSRSGSLQAPGGVGHFDRLELDKINKTPENLEFLQRDPETLNFHDLRRQIAELRAGSGDSADIRNAEVSLWFKISLPFSCLIFGLVGAPLGMRSPRSAKVSGSVWALPIMLGYYVIYMTMRTSRRAAAFPRSWRPGCRTSWGCWSAPV